MNDSRRDAEARSEDELIFESGELSPAATVSKMGTVQSEGGREVVREVEYYHLDAVGLVT